MKFLIVYENGTTLFKQSHDLFELMIDLGYYGRQEVASIHILSMFPTGIEAE